MTSNSLRTRFVYYAILVVLLLVGAGNASADMITVINLPENTWFQSMGVTPTGFIGITNTYAGMYGTATVYNFGLDGTYTTQSLAPLPGYTGAHASVSPDGQTIAGTSFATNQAAMTNWSSGSPTAIPGGTNTNVLAVGNGGRVGGGNVFPYAGTVNGVSQVSNTSGAVAAVSSTTYGGGTDNGPAYWRDGTETTLSHTGFGGIMALSPNIGWGDDDGLFSLWLLSDGSEFFPQYNGAYVEGYFSGALSNRDVAWGNSAYGALMSTPDGRGLTTFLSVCQGDLGPLCTLTHNPTAVHSLVEGHGMWAYNAQGSNLFVMQTVPSAYRSDPSAVPEPGSLLLLATGLGLVALGRKRLNRTP